MAEKISWLQLQPLYEYLRQQADKKKTYKYLEIGATFSLIAVFLFTAIAPTAAAISRLLGEIKSKQILEKKLKTKIESIILAQDNYSLMQENSRYQLLESSFPSRPRYYQAASVFSSSSLNSGSNLERITFSINDKPITNSTDSKLSYGINALAQTSYQSSLQMINNIINSRRVVDIESITLNQVDKKDKVASNSAFINLNLSTNLFYLPTAYNEQK